MTKAELSALDATAQAELVRDGEVTPLELVEAAIARIEEIDPALNAVIHRFFDRARELAGRDDLPDGPFRGVPFLVKDVVCHTAADPYHCGMRFLRDLGWTEKNDTHLAARFRAAGFVFIGKTNTPELAFAPTAEPVAYGPTRNPWDRGRTTGGSSGGAAAAVASGMVGAAHGNDMGGSIRIPASACGLVGLKPTRGRTTLGPDFGEHWWMLTHEHVLTRTVRDTAAILDAVAGPAPGDPYYAPPPARPFAEEVGAPPGRLRIGFRTLLPGGVEEAHEDCRQAVRGAAVLLESLGHRLEPSSPAALDDAESMAKAGIVLCVSVARELERWSARTGRRITAGDVEPTTWLAAEVGRASTACQLVEATDVLNGLTRRLARWWHDGFDLLLTPTLAHAPPELGVLAAGGVPPGETVRRWQVFAPFTMPFNVSGQPAISLPLHWNEAGLPIGVQLVAAYGREDLLIRVASQLEEACGWAKRRPAL